MDKKILELIKIYEKRIANLEKLIREGTDLNEKRNNEIAFILWKTVIKDLKKIIR